MSANPSPSPNTHISSSLSLQPAPSQNADGTIWHLPAETINVVLKIVINDLPSSRYDTNGDHTQSPSRQDFLLVLARVHRQWRKFAQVELWQDIVIEGPDASQTALMLADASRARAASGTSLDTNSIHLEGCSFDSAEAALRGLVGLRKLRLEEIRGSVSGSLLQLPSLVDLEALHLTAVTYRPHLPTAFAFSLEKVVIGPHNQWVGRDCLPLLLSSSTTSLELSFEVSRNIFPYPLLTLEQHAPTLTHLALLDLPPYWLPSLGRFLTLLPRLTTFKGDAVNLALLQALPTTITVLVLDHISTLDTPSLAALVEQRIDNLGQHRLIFPCLGQLDILVVDPVTRVVDHKGYRCLNRLLLACQARSILVRKNGAPFDAVDEWEAGMAGEDRVRQVQGDEDLSFWIKEEGTDLEIDEMEEQDKLGTTDEELDEDEDEELDEDEDEELDEDEDEELDEDEDEDEELDEELDEYLEVGDLEEELDEDNSSEEEEFDWGERVEEDEPEVD